MKVDLPTLSYEPACFAAGTLVHAKNGLVPIEQIQVGDWVLSKHESGEGEREYKRVTKTFVHEDREVMMISVGGLQEDGRRRAHRFIVTPEHPIWVQGKGWKPAGKLKWTVPFWDVELLIPDRSHVVNNPLRLLITDQENVAWFPVTSAPSDLQYKGGRINVNTMEIVNRDASLNIDYVSNTKRVKPEHLFRTTVYNLEVEDFHTYYVGNAGMWVHNKQKPSRFNASA